MASDDPVDHRGDDARWRETLTAEQYAVARQGGTERAFSGALWDCHEDGSYRCVCCAAELFTSTDKYDSGSGWPSFVRAANGAPIRELVDTSHGMQRTEVRCGSCDAHLGHLFDDGPKPTGNRYCINSASLRFEGP